MGVYLDVDFKTYSFTEPKDVNNSNRKYMRIKILTGIGAIMLVAFLLFGFFAFPIGIPLVSMIGLMYGMKNKDRSFIKWSVVALFIGIACIVNTLLVIKSMW